MGHDTNGGTQKTPTTKQSLLAELREDPDSPRLGEFARIYEPVMRRYASYAIESLRGCLCDADRDDLVQEAFLAVWSALPRFHYDPSKGRFRNYVSAIVRNVACRLLKRASDRRRLETAAQEAFAADAADVASEDERDMMLSAWSVAYAIVAAKRKFTPNTLAVFQCHALDGVPAEEVAVAFKLTANAVYQIKDRIVRAVRGEIRSAWSHCPSGDLVGLVEELYRRSDALHKRLAGDF